MTTYETQNFEIFDKVLHNFGKSDESLFNEKLLISKRCISGLMPNLIKKSWMVSNVTYLLSKNFCFDLAFMYDQGIIFSLFIQKGQRFLHILNHEMLKWEFNN